MLVLSFAACFACTTSSKYLCLLGFSPVLCCICTCTFLVLLQLPVLVLACLFKAGRLSLSVLGFFTCFTCTKGSSQVAAAYSKRAACFVSICTCVFLLAALLCLCLKFVLAGSSLPIQSGQLLATLPIKQVAAGRQGQGATITRACSPTTLLLSSCSPTTTLLLKLVLTHQTLYLARAHPPLSRAQQQAHPPVDSCSRF